MPTDGSPGTTQQSLTDHSRVCSHHLPSASRPGQGAQSDGGHDARSLDTWGEGSRKLIRRFKRPYLPISEYRAVRVAPRKGEENVCPFLPFSVVHVTCSPSSLVSLLFGHQALCCREGWLQGRPSFSLQSPRLISAQLSFIPWSPRAEISRCLFPKLSYSPKPVLVPSETLHGLVCCLPSRCQFLTVPSVSYKEETSG